MSIEKFSRTNTSERGTRSGQMIDMCLIFKFKEELDHLSTQAPCYTNCIQRNLAKNTEKGKEISGKDFDASI